VFVTDTTTITATINGAQRHEGVLGEWGIPPLLWPRH